MIRLLLWVVLAFVIDKLVVSFNFGDVQMLDVVRNRTRSCDGVFGIAIESFNLFPQVWINPSQLIEMINLVASVELELWINFFRLLASFLRRRSWRPLLNLHFLVGQIAAFLDESQL